MAYKWGTCHSGPDNDVWGYNLAANNWRQMYPCDPTVQAQPASIVVRDSVLMTETGHPLSFHQWSGMDWDPVHKSIWWFNIGGWNGLYSGHLDTVAKYHPDSCVQTANKVLWEYSPAANKWTAHKMSTPYPIVYYGNTYVPFRYVPYLKKFIGIHNTGYGDGYFSFFDPESMTLIKKLVAFDTLPGDYGAEKTFDVRLMGCVYDTKHDLLITQGRGTGTWAYNPKTNHYTELTLTAATPPVWTDCPESYMVWDSRNEKVLVFVTAGGQSCYDVDSTYAQRGWPSSGTHVFAFDYDNRKWDMLPAPTSGDNPDNITGQMGFAYFDTKYGVLFHMGGSYCGTNGERWVYKYANGTGVEQAAAANRRPDPLTIRPSVFTHSAQILVSDLDRCNASLKIYSPDGKLVRDYSRALRFSSMVVFDAAGLRAGVYFVRLAGGKDRFVKKISCVK
jgi:hypothetical protein